ncbi:MAG: competence/damage-inducible protein A, partial [Pseudomonadota bacterium]
RAFGRRVIKNAEAMAIMEPRFKPGEFNEARQKMACTPEGATLIENTVSAAPGFQVENVFVLAGVPSIMRAMIDTLKNRLVGGAPMLSRTITVFLGEGTVAEGLATVQEKYNDVDIGSYPFYRDGRFGTSLVLRGVDDGKLSQAADDTAEMIRGLGGEPLFD